LNSSSDLKIDPLVWLREQLEHTHPDLLHELTAAITQQLMAAEAQEACGAESGERSADRVNSRNGYRLRDWDTRVGSIQLAVPKLRQGSYFPDWAASAPVAGGASNGGRQAGMLNQQQAKRPTPVNEPLLTLLWLRDQPEPSLIRHDLSAAVGMSADRVFGERIGPVETCF